MLKIVLAASLVGLGSPALAAQCPSLWQRIDDTLQEAYAGAGNAEAMDLRKQGEDLHQAGDHAKAEEVLEMALALVETH